LLASREALREVDFPFSPRFFSNSASGLVGLLLAILLPFRRMVKEDRIVTEQRQSVTGISGRYATALFELAEAAGQLDGVGNDLSRFSSLLDENADLDRLVRSPVFTADEQQAALDAVLVKAGIDGLAANFIKLVAKKRRLFHLRSMIDGYRALKAQKMGIVSAEVTLASPLSDQNRAALLEVLKTRTGKSVDLSEHVDPAIIGGLIVKMGSKMIDASLKTRLNAMKIAMKSA
jgi:F-type H+-transporting ATPase subunit delta